MYMCTTDPSPNTISRDTQTKRSPSLSTITREGLSNRNLHFQTKGSILLGRILKFAIELYKPPLLGLFSTRPQMKSESESECSV